ncbi:MAG: hypothetical protein JWO86_7031, partial [Myxococcaceae bacterium]|nr:hypothetical protein [Myxococcaceae bacterium]
MHEGRVARVVVALALSAVAAFGIAACGRRGDADASADASAEADADASAEASGEAGGGSGAAAEPFGHARTAPRTLCSGVAGKHVTERDL